MESSDEEVKLVTHWIAPKADGPRILSMPNIPHPLHGLAPRTVIGNSAWNVMRKRCYYDAGYKCQACGKQCEPGQCDAHELYTINYVTGESKFERCVCLCRICHRLSIHTGRALTLYKKKSPMMSKEKLLEGAENAFRLVGEYNKEHQKLEPVRLFSTFKDYFDVPELHDKMVELQEKYDIKFYEPTHKAMADWSKWHLVYGSKSYKTPYANAEEWAEAMEKLNRKDPLRERPRVISETDKEVEAILNSIKEY